MVSAVWELNYEEAALHAGLEVNPVAEDVPVPEVQPAATEVDR